MTSSKLATLGCGVSKQKAIRFRAIADALGMSTSALLNEAIDLLLDSSIEIDVFGSVEIKSDIKPVIVIEDLRDAVASTKKVAADIEEAIKTLSAKSNERIRKGIQDEVKEMQNLAVRSRDIAESMGFLLSEVEQNAKTVRVNNPEQLNDARDELRYLLENDDGSDRSVTFNDIPEMLDGTSVKDFSGDTYFTKRQKAKRICGLTYSEDRQLRDVSELLGLSYSQVLRLGLATLLNTRIFLASEYKPAPMTGNLNVVTVGEVNQLQMQIRGIGYNINQAVHQINLIAKMLREDSRQPIFNNDVHAILIASWHALSSLQDLADAAFGDPTVLVSTPSKDSIKRLRRKFSGILEKKDNGVRVTYPYIGEIVKTMDEMGEGYFDPPLGEIAKTSQKKH
jgi:hypothetical protein